MMLLRHCAVLEVQTSLQISKLKKSEQAVMLHFAFYQKFTTCQKAKKWLDNNKIKYKIRVIKKNVLK